MLIQHRYSAKSEADNRSQPWYAPRTSNHVLLIVITVDTVVRQRKAEIRI